MKTSTLSKSIVGFSVFALVYCFVCVSDSFANDKETETTTNAEESEGGCHGAA